MPFDLRDVDRASAQFTLAAAAGYAPSEPEQTCLDRINGLLTMLAAIADDGTPRGAEAVSTRNYCREQLRARAREFVAGMLDANELYLTSFKYEGRFEERLARIRAASIVVSPYRDPNLPEMYVDIQYDIGQGITTKEQLDLKRAIDKAVTVVKVVLAGSGSDAVKRHEYIRALVSIGRVGLLEGNIDLAKSTLDTLQEEFVAREAARIKNNYVRRLGAWSILCVVIFGLAYLYIRAEAVAGNGAIDWRLWLLPENANPAHPFALYRFRNFFLLAIGASFSAWLAFLIRRPTLEFTGLVQLDDDLLNPVIRVLFTIGLSFVVGLLFWTGLIAITIGSFTTNFENAGMTAILIGVFCGIASRALATAVSRRAEDFAGNVGASAAARAGAVPVP